MGSAPCTSCAIATTGTLRTGPRFDGRFLHPAVLHRWSGITALGLTKAEQSGFCGRLVLAADSGSEVAAKGRFRGVGRERVIHVNSERLGSEFPAGATRSRRGPPNPVRGARRALRAARLVGVPGGRYAQPPLSHEWILFPLSPPPLPLTLSPSRSPWTSG